MSDVSTPSEKLNMKHYTMCLVSETQQLTYRDVTVHYTLYTLINLTI